MTSLAKVPCTIVTGFLGAGKTTLVRHVLENADGRRLAVVVNEFGDVGIDGEILKNCGIESCTEDSIVELANGCICCTVADDFIPALTGLLDRPLPPEHIVIETSGLALPKPLVQAFNWPAIASRVTVDGVVAVVDGSAVAAGRFADDPEDQILCADLVILNKADLISATELQQVNDRIGQTLSPAVKVVEAENGKVPISVLLGLGARAEADVENRRSHHDDEEDHDHEDFETFVVEIPTTDSGADLAARIARTAERHDVLRVKGFAEVRGKPMRLLVQGVGGRIQHHFDRAWKPGEDRRGRLVVIAEKGIDQTAVRADLLG